MATIAELIKQIRLQHREWTQARFAAVLRVSEPSVRNYEGDRHDPEPTVLLRLAEAAPEQMRGQVIAAFPEEFRDESILGIFESLTSGERERIRQLSKQAKKTVAEYCAQLIHSGLLVEVRGMQDALQSSSKAPPAAFKKGEAQQYRKTNVAAQRKSRKPATDEPSKIKTA